MKTAKAIVVLIREQGIIDKLNADFVDIAPLWRVSNPPSPLAVDPTGAEATGCAGDSNGSLKKRHQAVD